MITSRRHLLVALGLALPVAAGGVPALAATTATAPKPVHHVTHTHAAQKHVAQRHGTRTHVARTHAGSHTHVAQQHHAAHRHLAQKKPVHHVAPKKPA